MAYVDPISDAPSSEPTGEAATRLRERFIRLQAEQLARYGAHAVSKFVAIRNPAIRVHVLTAGEGEPVLFFHGGDGEAVDWAPLIAELQHDVQIIGVDRPGFGLTDAFDYSSVDLRQHAGDFIVSLLDALGLERATLVGGSMGGFFALSAALDHPARVNRVVLVGMAAGITLDVGDQLPKLCGTPGAAQAFMQNAASLEAQREQYRLMFGIDPDTVPESYFQTRLAGLRMPGAQDTWATLLTRLADGNGLRPEVYLGKDLPALRVPVLMLWGAHDMAPPTVGREAARLMPNCRFLTLPGVGHFPFLEAPRETAQAIREFIATH